MHPLPHFRFWCQTVLPLVYDNALSYIEVLHKVVDYLNHMVDDQNRMISDIDGLKQDLAVVQKWISDFEPNVANEIIEKYIARGVYFGLNDAGYFVAYIPQTWQAIRFNTTGLDITLPGRNYGHLVLSY